MLARTEIDMPKNDESFRDRLSKFTLAHWGGLCMFGGGMAGVIGTMQPAKNRAELLGRGVAVAIFWVIGLVLVVLHFVRRGRKKTEKKRKPTSSQKPGSQRPRRPGS